MGLKMIGEGQAFVSLFYTVDRSIVCLTVRRNQKEKSIERFVSVTSR